MNSWIVQELKEWITRILPEEFASVCGTSCESTAAEILGRYGQDGFLLALDYSKAYDRLHPVLTTALLRRLGLPEDLLQVLTEVWGQQRRWLCWQQHVHHAPLVAPAMPQGDPLGPLVMSLWVAAGHSLITAGRGVFSRIYIDDRTVVATSPEEIAHQLQEWETRSFSVGLRENADKAVCMGRNARKKRVLEALLPGNVRDEVVILGVSTRVRGLSAREEVRVQEAMRIIALLSCCGLGFGHYLRVVRQFAMSRAAYGWVAHWPSLHVSKRLWTAVRRGCKRLRSSSPWLFGAVFGGNLHLDALFATRLTGTLARLRAKGPLTWTQTPGSPVKALDSWLIKRGWQRRAPFLWWHGVAKVRLDLRGRGPVGRFQHVVRAGWRAWCLAQHVASDRRDADEVELGLFDRIASRIRGGGPFRAPKREPSLAGLLGALPPCKVVSRRGLVLGASSASMRATGTTLRGPVLSGLCPGFLGRTCVLSRGSDGAFGVLLALVWRVLR